MLRAAARRSGEALGQADALNDVVVGRGARANVVYLRAEVDGRICFVGYTATAVADFIPTPVYSSMPGVMAHANMANMREVAVRCVFVEMSRPIR